MTMEDCTCFWLDHNVGELMYCGRNAYSNDTAAAATVFDKYVSSVSPEYYFYVFYDMSVSINHRIISVMTATFGFSTDVAINIIRTWVGRKLNHHD